MNGISEFKEASTNSSSAQERDLTGFVHLAQTLRPEEYEQQRNTAHPAARASAVCNSVAFDRSTLQALAA